MQSKPLVGCQGRLTVPPSLPLVESMLTSTAYCEMVHKHPVEKVHIVLSQVAQIEESTYVCGLQGQLSQTCRSLVSSLSSQHESITYIASSELHSFPLEAVSSRMSGGTFERELGEMYRSGRCVRVRR